MINKLSTIWVKFVYCYSFLNNHMAQFKKYKIINGFILCCIDILSQCSKFHFLIMIIDDYLDNYIWNFLYFVQVFIIL